jgi:hypothetical protein
MEIKVPKIVRPLDLQDYAPEMDGMLLQVWVNPPRKLVARYVEIQDEIVKLKGKLDEIVERSKNDGVGEDLTADIEKLDTSIQAMNADLFAWFAEVWSQGGHNETAETVAEFAKQFGDTDPALWGFVSKRTVEMIRDHRQGAQKN